MRDISKLKEKLGDIPVYHRPLCSFCKTELSARNMDSVKYGLPACSKHNRLIQQMYRKDARWFLTEKAGIPNARKLGVDESVIMLYSEYPPPKAAVKAAIFPLEKSLGTGVGGTNTNESLYLAKHSSNFSAGDSRRVQDVSGDPAPLQQSEGAVDVSPVGGQNLRAREDDPY